jgi:MFS family permease
MDTPLSDSEALRAAKRFVVLIGIVSLFGDMTYEGGRSVVGPYLGTLGASAAIVGTVAGFGELAGYVLRLASGYVGDRTGLYWPVTIAGYVINLFAVPLLAVAGSWEWAVVLIVAERAGRALRTPTRDAMLSQAATRTGAGWAFGFHEALDSTGAVIGPLLVSFVLYAGGTYRFGFGLLLVPALLCMLVLLIARSQFPTPSRLEIKEAVHEPKSLPARFWLFACASALVGAGYADFSLLAFHFAKTAVVAAPLVPVLYALAMFASCIAALVLGRAFDRHGMKTLIPAVAVAAFGAPLAFLGGPLVVIVGVILWGIGMAAQESIMRAIVGTMAPAERRATSFGIFHTIFGVAWFLGSTLLGFLYDQSLLLVSFVSLSLQLLSLPAFWWLLRAREQARLESKAG